MNTPMAIAQRAFAITKHDTNENRCDRIYVGGAGTVVVDTVGGDTNVSFECPAGVYLDVQVLRVKDATDATLLVGLQFTRP